jgi:putative membrane-bound dehydrogenase-like protein
MVIFRVLLVLWVGGIIAVGQELPKVNDDRLAITMFASEPLIQQPTGITFDKHGLIVIESHTHFRPKDWQGPAHDQIVRLIDKDGNGTADTRQVIFDQTDATMDIARHPDGSLYVAARNEILRLNDADGDGQYEHVTRRIVFLDTTANYPHNGLSGLAFDKDGNLYFGMGENLGAGYTLKAGATEIKDQGEGGNIFWCTKDGKRLKRIATGFWNPFGVCVGPFGNVFATDNDPDSSPPCRLHHIIESGDYGYQFRYGRSGLHPFISWNGEMKGTLPMLAGTGEAPCDVLWYQSPPHTASVGLGGVWAQSLLVASWVDHRVESYQLSPADGTFRAERRLLVEGGNDFRPVAFAIADDGALFLSDWVKRDYNLHGHGRIWRLAGKSPTPSIASPTPEPDPGTTLRERIMHGPAPSETEAIAWLQEKRPYLLTPAIWRMAREGSLLTSLANASTGDSTLDASVLLAARKAVEYEGVGMNDTANRLLARTINHPDEQLALLALKWISDDRIKSHRPLLDALLQDSSLSPKLYYATITALARIDSGETNEAQLIARLKADIASPDTTAMRKQQALSILPDRDKQLKLSDVTALLDKASEEHKIWLVHYLANLRDPARTDVIRKLAMNRDEAPKIRAAALGHITATQADVGPVIAIALAVKGDPALRTAALQSLQGSKLGADQLQALSSIDNPGMKAMAERLKGGTYTSALRPLATSPKAWSTFLKQVPGPVDIAQGRSVFMSPKLGGCAACHQVEGIGSMAGPQLSTIGKALDPNYLLQSLLQPNANVAPQYAAMTIITTDGQGRTAFPLIERGGNHSYIDIAGNHFEVKIDDIVSRIPLPVSIMPEGIVNRLTDAEVRDLVAYLTAQARP